MGSQMNGLQQAAEQAASKENLIQTAESVLENTSENIQRIRQLVSCAASDALVESDLDKLQLEIDELQADTQRELDTATFNGKQLFRPSGETTYNFQVGANIDEIQSVRIAVDPTAINDNLNSIVVNKNANVDTSGLLGTADSLLENLSEAKALLGAQQNSLQKST